MRCKEVMEILLTLVCLIIKTRTSISKQKGILEVSLYIWQPPITVTYINPVIFTSLSIFFFLISMLRSNVRSY